MKEYETDDPMELHGEGIFGDPRAMLDCIVEEYLDQGLSANEVLHIFESPFYQAAHKLLKFFGQDEVRRIIEEKAALGVTFFVQETTLKGGTDE